MRHGTSTGPSLHGLKEGKNASDGCGPRLAAVAKVEYEARITHRFTAEAGWRYVSDAKEFFLPGGAVARA